MVTAKYIKEFNRASFQLGIKNPKIKFGSKNKIIIFAEDNAIRLGINLVNN